MTLPARLAALAAAYTTALLLLHTTMPWGWAFAGASLAAVLGLLGAGLARAADRPMPRPPAPDPVDVATAYHAEVDGIHEAIVADFLGELEQYQRGERAL